jgi:hypothetical protein
MSSGRSSPARSIWPILAGISLGLKHQMMVSFGSRSSLLLRRLSVARLMVFRSLERFMSDWTAL